MAPFFGAEEDLGRIADVVESEMGSGSLPVCVVSAMKGVTDKIINALSQVQDGGVRAERPSSRA